MGIDCCVHEFLNGGMIQEASITSSRISDSIVTGSKVVSCDIAELATLDANSAQKIADTIAALPTEQLRNLAAAIAQALPAAPVGNAPVQTQEAELPTTVLGDRAMLLGKPANWLQYKDYVIPAFKEDN